MGLTKPRASQIYNLDYKQATRVVTVTNITLSGGAPSSVDGVSLSTNDRVLVTGQSTASQNGIYDVVTVGTGSSGTWARTSDANNTGEIEAGMIIMVTEGNIYADTQWKLITDNPITIGSTALIFTQNYSANSISGGTSNVTVYSNANVTISSAGTANVLTVSSTGAIISGNLIPSGNAVYTLGNPTNYWKSLYVGGNTIYLGNITLGSSSGLLTVNDANVVTTDSSGNTSVSGNITGGNIATGGTVSATGNVTGNYLFGNGSQITGIVVSAGAAITNGTSNVTVGASSNVTIGVAGATTATFASSGIYTPGILSATGNVVGNYILGNGASLTGVITSVANINNGTSNVTVTGSGANITVGVGGTPNVVVWATSGEYVTGVISANGSVTGGNITTGGLISATGTITGANITGANLLTGGLVSATGNITGGYIIGNGSQLTGLPAGYTNSNLATLGSNVISTTGTITGGNITGANLLTSGLVSATGNITGGNVNTLQLYSSGTLTITNGSGNINLSPTGNVVLNNNYLSGLQLNPVGNSDAATKYYVDQQVSTGLSYHTPVYAATTTTLATTTGGTITYNQPNGVANGVGATLKTTGSFNLIDTANVQTANTRILIKDEGNAVFNGVYYWANSTTIIRTTDADEYGSNSSETLSLNDYFFVTNGSTNAGSAWVVNAPTSTITFGSSNITFAQFSTSQVYSAGNGISIAGTVVSARVDNTTTAFDGGGNITVKASAQLTTPNIGAATGTSVSVTGTVTGSSLTGTITTASQTNITSVGTLGSLSVTGNATVGNISATNHTGTNVSVTGTQTAASTVGGVITGSSVSVTGAVISNTVSATTTITATTSVQAANIITTSGRMHGCTSVTLQNNNGTLANIANIVIGATGNITLTTGNISAFAVVSGNLSVTGAVTAASVVGGVITGTSTSVTGTQTAASTVGGVITGSSVSVTGNVTGATHAGTIVSVTGNITGSYFIGNGSQLTGISAGGGNSITNGTSNVVVASGGNVSIAVAGANVITIASTGIINNQANGVGNIGSSTGYFNTVFAKATSAQYADLAEMYVADQNYPAGTVVEFSGNFEITATTQTHSTRTAGIVSTSPSYLMNSTQEGEHVLPIALTGRVPCQVVGTIRKGDRLVSSGIPGVATALDKTLYEPGCIIGKALEDYDSINNGIIEVAVGRF